MICKRCVFFFFFFAIISGCTSKEHVLRGIYEGMQTREQMINSSEPVPPPHPSYDQYQKEREKILNKDKAEQP